MRRDSVGSGDGWAMDTSTYTTLRSGRAIGSWSSGKKEVKVASRRRK